MKLIDRIKKAKPSKCLMKILNEFISGDFLKAGGVIIDNEDNDLKLGMGTLENQSTPIKYNTALGHWTLGSNTIGDNNIGLGYATLYLNQTGNGNVAVGNWSLYYNTAGHHNLAIGYSAGQKITGSYNIALGKESLFNNHGNHNVALGIGAGQSHVNGDANIYIGNNHGKATESNKMYLGNVDDGKSIIEAEMTGANKNVTLNSEVIKMPELPTSDAGLPSGAIWNDNGTLKIKP